MNEIKRENWSGTLGFVLASAGSAIGLGNVWKFPYITGLNGGGAFVMVYLLCILFIGMPIMICEMTIGRRTRKNPYGAFASLQVRRSVTATLLGALLLAAGIFFAFSGSYGFAFFASVGALMLLTLGYGAIGLFSLIAAMLILSYYSVVGGWIVEYVWRSFSGQLAFNTAQEAGDAFAAYLTETPGRVAIDHLIFLAITALMVWSGIRNGIERWSRILMPALFLLLLAVIVRSVTLPGAEAGIAFFLKPDFSKLSTAGLLEALGHAFYTLSLGMGITITYGSYLKREQNIFKAATWIVVLDTLAAMMAGLAIFPAVFAMGFDPAAGAGLIFNILPATFNHFPGGLGWLWAGLFFLMLTIAALTSAASLLESGVTFLIDQFRMPRKAAVLLVFVSIGALGILSSVSVANWDELPSLHGTLQLFYPSDVLQDSWFNVLDQLTSNWMLPLSGLFTAIFAGWIWTTRKAGRELRRGAESIADQNLVTWLSGFRGEPLYRIGSNHGLTLMTLWALLLRFIAPIVVLIVFLQLIGVPLGF